MASLAQQPEDREELMFELELDLDKERADAEVQRKK